MKGDKIIIALDAGKFAIQTTAVAGVVEVEKLPFLPGRAGFVTGIISFRNEPVAVVDLAMALGDFSPAERSTHKVIVLRDKGRTLGMDIGEAALSFLWDEEIGGKTTDEKGLFTSGRIYAKDSTIEIIDWPALFNETSRMLTTEENVEKSPNS